MSRNFKKLHQVIDNKILHKESTSPATKHQLQVYGITLTNTKLSITYENSVAPTTPAPTPAPTPATPAPTPATPTPGISASSPRYIVTDDKKYYVCYDDNTPPNIGLCALTTINQKKKYTKLELVPLSGSQNNYKTTINSITYYLTSKSIYFTDNYELILTKKKDNIVQLFTKEDTLQCINGGTSKLLGNFWLQVLKSSPDEFTTPLQIIDTKNTKTKYKFIQSTTSVTTPVPTPVPTPDSIYIVTKTPIYYVGYINSSLPDIGICTSDMLSFQEYKKLLLVPLSGYPNNYKTTINSFTYYLIYKEVNDVFTGSSIKLTLKKSSSIPNTIVKLVISEDDKLTYTIKDDSGKTTSYWPKELASSPKKFAPLYLQTNRQIQTVYNIVPSTSSII